jgi:hypothetical protein
MDGHFDESAVARFDQTRAEAADWATALIELRTRLCSGGYSPREAYHLARLWFGEHLCHQLTELGSDER